MKRQSRYSGIYGKLSIEIEIEFSITQQNMELSQVDQVNIWRHVVFHLRKSVNLYSTHLRIALNWYKNFHSSMRSNDDDDYDYDNDIKDND